MHTGEHKLGAVPAGQEEQKVREHKATTVVTNCIYTIHTFACRTGVYMNSVEWL